MKTEAFDPKRHGGRKLYELADVRDGKVVATVAVPSEATFEEASMAPWQYVVEKKGQS